MAHARTNFEEERARRPHFDAEPCRVCGEPCNGYLSCNGRAALCLRARSKTPDPVQLGYWHLIGGRKCTCGEVHGVARPQQ